MDPSASLCALFSDLKDVVRLIAQLAVYPGDLLAPAPTLVMLSVHYLFLRPVEVIRNKGHLLIQHVEGIAHQHSPRPFPPASKWGSHCGQITFVVPFPSVFTRW